MNFCTLNFSGKQKIATPLGTIPSTDEKIVAQADVKFLASTVESLIVEFDQEKFEEFLSSGSKSPKAKQYHKVSSGLALKSLQRLL